MKYNIGDKVRIRSWDDMQKEYGLDRDGDIKTPICFVSSMKQYCGKIMTIAKVDTVHYYMEEDKGEWSWCDEMAAGLADEAKIVITTDGKETLARLYKGGEVVKSATAKCNPADIFDFKAGAALAFERLMTPKFELGTRVRVIDKFDGKNLKGKLGTIVEIKPKSSIYDCGVEFDDDIAGHTCGGNAKNNHGRYGCFKELEIVTDEKPKSKFKVGDRVRRIRRGNVDFNVGEIGVIVEDDGTDVPYKVQREKDGEISWNMAGNLEKVKEPKYYTGKVVCVKTGFPDFWTVGKIYEVKDGITRNNRGCKREHITEKNLCHIGSDQNEFIPVVE